MVDGSTQTSPYTANLPPGTHMVSVPPSTTYGNVTYGFDSWNDGDTNISKTVNLQGATVLAATYLSPIGVVAGDADVYGSTITNPGAHHLLRDSFGKTMAFYRSTNGSLAVAVANKDPESFGWMAPFRSTFTNVKDPVAALMSDNEVRILFRSTSEVITDVQMLIVRDSSNNIMGVTFGSPITIDRGETHCLIKAHDGSLWACFNQRDGIYPNWTNSKIMVAHWTPAGTGPAGWTVDTLFVDGVNTHSIFTALVQRDDTKALYVAANRSSVDNHLILGIARYSGSAWTWTVNGVFAANIAVGQESAPDLVYDPNGGRVILVHDIAGQNRFAVYYFDANDVPVHDDTPVLQVTKTKWNKILVIAGSLFIAFEDPSAGLTMGHVLATGRGPNGWLTVPATLDPEATNVTISGYPWVGVDEVIYLKNATLPVFVRWAHLPPMTLP